MLALVVGCFASLLQTTNAAENKYTASYGDVYSVHFGNRDEPVVRFELQNDQGDPIGYAYSITTEIHPYNGATYKPAPVTDYFKTDQAQQVMAAITYITNNYAWMETTDFAGYQQIIQPTIWKIIHGIEVTAIKNTNEKQIIDILNSIQDNIDNILKEYNTGVTLQGTKGTGISSAGYTDYGPFQVSTTILGKVDYKLAFTSTSKNATFVDTTGNTIHQVKPGEQFYVRVTNDITGDIEFNVSLATTQSINYVYDLNCFVDTKDGITHPPLVQPLFEPLTNRGNKNQEFAYSANHSFTITPTTQTEKITITAINWNNGQTNNKDGANGGGINQLTVKNIILKNNKNYVTPTNFEATITKTPSKNDNTAIYTVVERTVTNNGAYTKVYDTKIALFENNVWKVYSGSIPLNNPGGNDKNLKIDLTRIA